MYLVTLRGQQITKFCILAGGTKGNWREFEKATSKGGTNGPALGEPTGAQHVAAPSEVDTEPFKIH